MKAMPLFPLSGVLMPFGRVPLQIFEPRYTDLVRDSLKSNSPFGVVWIRRGSEISQRGTAAPTLGDYGTTARIVDWDQLPNGLLGITIEGGQRFHVDDVWRESSGLNRARVDVEPWPEPVAVPQEGVSMIDVLAGLQRHPEVKRLGLSLDTENAWDVCHVLTQLLPIENSVKYELLGLTDITQYIDQLDVLLSEMSG